MENVLVSSRKAGEGRTGGRGAEGRGGEEDTEDNEDQLTHLFCLSTTPILYIRFPRWKKQQPPPPRNPTHVWCVGVYAAFFCLKYHPHRFRLPVTITVAGTVLVAVVVPVFMTVAVIVALAVTVDVT